MVSGYIMNKLCLHRIAIGSVSWYTISSHFREPKVLKACIESIITIITCLHASVKQLEEITLPLHVESAYQPLEHLNECSLFQKDSSTFKADEIKVSVALPFQSLSIIIIVLIIFAGPLQHISVLSIATVDTIMSADTVC